MQLNTLKGNISEMVHDRETVTTGNQHKVIYDLLHIAMSKDLSVLPGHSPVTSFLQIQLYLNIVLLLIRKCVCKAECLVISLLH